MGWNTASVHRLAGFKVAKDWHDRTRPIRGDKDKVRPLGSRRHHVMADIHMPNEDTVQLRYYRQTLVEWRSDDTYSLYSPRYYTAFVPDNIHNFLPLVGQGFEWRDGRMFYVHGNEVYLLPRNSKDSLEFQFVDGKSYLLNAPVAYNYRAKRNMKKKLLSKYEDFVSWMQVVLAVTDRFSQDELAPSFEKFVGELGFINEKEYIEQGTLHLTPQQRDDLWEERYARDALPFGYGYNEWRRGVGFNTEACEKVRDMLESGDAEQWVDVLHIMAHQAGRFMWQPTGRILSEPYAFDWLNTLVTYLHRDEVFERIRLPKGAMPTRTNTKYFRDSNFIPRKRRQVVGNSI